MKAKKKIKMLSVNRLDLYQTYLRETGRKVVRQGEFLWWAFHEAEGSNLERKNL